MHTASAYFHLCHECHAIDIHERAKGCLIAKTSTGTNTLHFQRIDAHTLWSGLRTTRYEYTSHTQGLLEETAVADCASCHSLHCSC